MRTLLGEPQVSSFTLCSCYFWVHSGKQTFCGIPDSRTVPRMGAQSMFAEWINEFMKTVYYVTVPTDNWNLCTSDETQIFVCYTIGDWRLPITDLEKTAG